MYKVIWNTEDCVDAMDKLYKTVNEAKWIIKDIYYFWMCEAQNDWEFNEKNPCFPIPTEEQIEDWDNMINNCYAYIIEVDKNGTPFSTDEDDEIWLSDKELNKMGWMEWEDLKNKFK